MPNWVMVPVPAEHEQSVLQRVIVLGMAASGGVAWSPELLARHFDALAPTTRSYRVVARRILASQPVEDTELAERFAMSVREVLGLAQEVNDATIDPFPGAIVVVQSEMVEGEAGGHRRVRSDGSARRRGDLRPPRRLLFVCRWLGRRAPLVRVEHLPEPFHPPSEPSVAPALEGEERPEVGRAPLVRLVVALGGHPDELVPLERDDLVVEIGPVVLVLLRLPAVE